MNSSQCPGPGLGLGGYSGFVKTSFRSPFRSIKLKLWSHQFCSLLAHTQMIGRLLRIILRRDIMMDSEDSGEDPFAHLSESIPEPKFREKDLVSRSM